jgi:diguanylate cyclase (GGDEF)-like protein
VAYGREPHHAVAVRDLRARRMAENEIRFLAHHDALTGLANRTTFAARLEQELRYAEAGGRRLAVLSIDLDRFKEVNDLFGHAAGDVVLRRVTEVVSNLLDETQLMARLGGDEFAILTRCDHPADAGQLAKRMQDTLSAACIENLPPIASSIGIALYPDDATDPKHLLSYADTALYRAKAERRGAYRYFEASMDALVRERRLMEHDLWNAVRNHEMHLVYQPQHQVATGAVIGFEVLLRWQHPQRGVVSPAEFIPIAEECGAILPIGAWVLSQACREAAGWTNPLAIAVNVSAVQIRAPHFVQSLSETLRETGLDPVRLEIEITETALIHDPEQAASTLRDLKALGVRLAMDDFGTGYSSLSNLRSYPFDKIKIDRSFIQSVDTNTQAAAIVRSVLGLGRGLGLPVLAEGVETQAELKFLQGEQCQAVQGYLMGRPAPIATYAALVGLALPDTSPLRKVA